MIKMMYFGKLIICLHQSAMDTGTDCSEVSKGKRGNGGYAYSYCSTVTSLCYG